MRSITVKLARLWLALCVGAAMTACGGGGGSPSAVFILPTQSPPDGGTAAPPAGPSTADLCNQLSGTVVDGGQITSATLVPESPTAKEYCKVNGTLHATLNFEVHLPTSWNGKLIFSGGGGWDGAFFPVPLSASSNAGYAVVATDGGNSGGNFFDASRFLKNPIRQQDFAYASTHLTLEAVKTILQSRYESPLKHSYFEGCSNGGREALIAATRFPDDFDGIIARAPAYSFTQLMAGGFLENSKAARAPGGWVSPVKAKLISDAVLAKCDALDSVVDGVVSNVAACKFDPSVLKCAGVVSDSCLTDGELTTARTAYSELRGSDGALIYPGWGPGGEDQGWPLWITGSAPGAASSQFMFADGLVKYWLTSEPNFDTLNFDRNLYASNLALANTLLDAAPDLRDYFAKGKKIILAHGTTDWAISYKGSVKYFDDVGALAGNSVRDANMSFYLLPGVGHCLGGSGPDTVDYLAAMSNWVENGVVPESTMTAEKFDAKSLKVTQSRPLCKYPAYPKYKGGGDVNSAENYLCTVD